MLRLFVLLFSLCSSFCCGIDRAVAREFERATRSAVGVLSTIPEEIREKRSGVMQQRVDISSEGVLTLSFSFPCRLPTSDGRKIVERVVKSSKSFRLGEFWASATQRYEVSRLFNTIAFYDHGCAWMLAFRSTADVEHAAKILATLVESISRETRPLVAPSKIVREHGFRYVVFAPRAPTLDAAVRLLNVPEQSSNLICWLTKQEPAITEQLLIESNNALPLFFYDLDILDKVPFYTVSSQGSTSFCQFDLDHEYVQSAFSDEEKELESFLHKADYCGIRFEAMPSVHTPHAILCSNNAKKMAQKVMAQGTEAVNIRKVIPKHFNPEMAQKYPCQWFLGINENSDDIFRYLFWEKKITKQVLSNLLYREFPELSVLLKTKSRYRKELSLEECIIMKMHTLQTLEKSLSPDSLRVLRVACFANELGAPFGPDGELYYNSWPLAQCLAEKVGLQEKEKEALNLLLIDQPAVDGKQNGKAQKGRSLLTLFNQEARKATELGISLGEWISMKTGFDFVLAKQFRSCPGGISSVLKKLREFSTEYKALMPFGIPYGIACLKGSLPAKNLFAVHIWEARDKNHRDGLSLKHRRDKFERMLMEKPRSPWRGRFFEWVDKEGGKDAIPSTVYLEKEEQRAAFLAAFENGLLTSPACPPGEERELIFVVDLKERLFLAPPKKATNPEESGFSHASFFAGGAVAAAGKIRVRGGQIIKVSADSDHYPSGPKDMKILLEVLERAGVVIDIPK